MYITLILRILPVLVLGNFASCTSPQQISNGHTSAASNKINNQESNEVGSPVAAKNITRKFVLKPCRRHLKRIESFIFPRGFTPFIPLCDSRGYYLPLQCRKTKHGGNCWCVDKNGNMKPGSKTSGKIDCGMKALKKPCESHQLRSLRHREKTNRPVFVPRCGEDGYYSPMQCIGGSKYCWCVDKYGHKKKGSRTKGVTDCSKPNGKGENIVDAFSANGAADGPCSQQKRQVKSLKPNTRRKYFLPECDENGFYAKKQCHSGYCWCADRDGNYIAGTKKKGDVNCESSLSSGPTRPPKNRCLIERRKGLQSMTKQQFVPLCSPDGSYAPLQCNTDPGLCWCADKWGNEITNTKTKRTPKCLTNGFTGPKKKPCHELKKYMKQLPSIGSIHIPVCKRNGFFRPLQCSRNKKYCWCVQQDGQEIRGTVTFKKTLQCLERSMNMTYVEIIGKKHGPCTRHQEKIEKMIDMVKRRMFTPRCNEDGYYDVKQCHGKICWCSDENGKTIRGTRRKGDVNCVKSPSPRTKACRENRRKALRMSLADKPYVPQCERNGDYTPLQCNVYTGVCWCVDKRGKELTGSRTKRTPNCFAKTFNTIDDGPCHILKKYVSKLPPNNKVYNPVCEGSGFFQPSQCGKSNGFCWCVLHDGTEVQGSITFGKPECHEKRSPAVPRLRGPCDEHLAHVNNMLSSERKNVYSPLCDDEGYYSPHQCNSDTTWCWCADRYGSMVPGTRVKGKVLNCDEKFLRPCEAFKKEKNEITSGVNDVYDAVCTKKGYFAPLQCNMDSGNCWCVDSVGAPVHGTTIYHRPYCGNKQRKCENERREILSKEKPAKPPPSCDVYGYYSLMQCDHSTNECWCTDRYVGSETVGTRIKGIASCGQLPRPCDEHASSVSNYDNLFGVFLPQCDSQGYYDISQCHEKTNVCWCSNKLGVEIPGTKTNGQPKCFF